MDDPFAHIPMLGAGQDGSAPEDESAKIHAGRWSTKVGRLAQGMAEPILGGAQFASHMTGVGQEYMDRKAQEAADLYKASRREAGLKPEDWDYFAGAGNIVSPINALPGAMLGRAARGAGLLRQAMTGAATGAASGALQPVARVTPENDYGSQKEAQIASGALAGGVLGPAAGVIGESVAPRVTPEARALMAEGVELTPGQMMGHGNIKRLEDIAATMPIVGSWVRAARERSLDTFNRAAGNRALAPIGERLPANVNAGHDMFNYIEGRIGERYNQLHPQMSLRYDERLGNDVSAIMQAGTALGADRANALQAIIGQQLNSKMANAPGGALSGRGIQSVTSELGRQARGYMTSPSFDQKELGAAINDLRGAVNAALVRQNPNQARELIATNDAWSHLMRLQQATGSSASQAREGVFTATQLGAAAQRQGTAREAARGTARYQDLAEAGRRLLPSTVADSGTPERLHTMALLGGAHAGLGPGAVAAAGLIPLMYSRAGQAFLRNALALRPHQADYISEILGRYAPGATAAAYPALQTQGE